MQCLGLIFCNYLAAYYSCMITFRVHICSGIMNSDESSKQAAYTEAYIENLRYAALEARKVFIYINL